MVQVDFLCAYRHLRITDTDPGFLNGCCQAIYRKTWMISQELSQDYATGLIAWKMVKSETLMHFRPRRNPLASFYFVVLLLANKMAEPINSFMTAVLNIEKPVH